MKEEKLQPVPQKYKRLLEITTNNQVPRNWMTVGKMDKYVETCNFPKLNQVEAENLNIPITTSEI